MAESFLEPAVAELFGVDDWPHLTHDAADRRQHEIGWSSEYPWTNRLRRAVRPSTTMPSGRRTWSSCGSIDVSVASSFPNLPTILRRLRRCPFAAVPPQGLEP